MAGALLNRRPWPSPLLLFVCFFRCSASLRAAGPRRTRRRPHPVPNRAGKRPRQLRARPSTAVRRGAPPRSPPAGPRARASSSASRTARRILAIRSASTTPTGPLSKRPKPSWVAFRTSARAPPPSPSDGASARTSLAPSVPARPKRPLATRPLSRLPPASRPAGTGAATPSVTSRRTAHSSRRGSRSTPAGRVAGKSPTPGPGAE